MTIDEHSVVQSSMYDPVHVCREAVFSDVDSAAVGGGLFDEQVYQRRIHRSSWARLVGAGGWHLQSSECCASQFYSIGYPRARLRAGARRGPRPCFCLRYLYADLGGKAGLKAVLEFRGKRKIMVAQGAAPKGPLRMQNTHRLS